MFLQQFFITKHLTAVPELLGKCLHAHQQKLQVWVPYVISFSDVGKMLIFKCDQTAGLTGHLTFILYD